MTRPQYTEHVVSAAAYQQFLKLFYATFYSQRFANSLFGYIRPYILIESQMPVLVDHVGPD